MNRPSHVLRIAVATALTGAIGAALAPAAALAASDSKLEEVVVLGTRRTTAVTETVAPVDIISGADFERLGNPEMDNALRSLVPSYNVSQQPINDESTLVRPANLRGLPPDNTLVLVNGKRRHRGGVITFLGDGVSDGAQGPDISPIPSIALKEVQVLRDGASAQYGSDAIAGVINFQLKDAPDGADLEVKYGTYYAGDGTTLLAAGNLGLPLGSSGFVNLSGEYNEADPTSRSVQRDDAAALIAAGNTAVPTPAAQVWGQPEIIDSIKFYVNSGFDINESTTIYAFGNYATREIDGGFYYRPPGGPVDAMPSIREAPEVPRCLWATSIRRTAPPARRLQTHPAARTRRDWPWYRLVGRSTANASYLTNCSPAASRRASAARSRINRWWQVSEESLEADCATT